MLKAIGILLLCTPLLCSAVQPIPSSASVVPLSNVSSRHSQSLFDQLFQLPESIDSAGSERPSSEVQDGGPNKYKIPYPIESLLERLNHQLGEDINGDQNDVKKVFIPFSRCVNRYAAAPNFYESPRIVVAANSEHHGQKSPNRIHLKNRIFLGYQQSANAIEVISYNDQLGEFTFQVVTNYAEDSTPEVSRANASQCLSCHQNKGPIFPRAPWAETDFNRKIFSHLSTARTEPLIDDQNSTGDDALINSAFDHPPVNQVIFGSKAVNIDNAINQANVLTLLQTFWRQACESANTRHQHRCLGALLELAIQYRLQETNRLLPSSSWVGEYFLPIVQSNAKTKWPEGIAFPSSDIDSKNPLAHSIPHFLQSAQELQNPRQTSIVWNVENMFRIIQGLGEQIPLSDVKHLDQLLVKSARNVSNAGSKLTGQCTLVRTDQRRVIFDKFDQSGDIELVCDFGQSFSSGTFSLIGDLRIQSGKVIDRPGFTKMFLDSPSIILEVAHSGGKIQQYGDGWKLHLSLLNTRHQLHGRLPDGSIVDAVEIHWQGKVLDSNEYYSERESIGTAILTLLPDPDTLHSAIEVLVNRTDRRVSSLLSGDTFQPTRLMRELFGVLSDI